MLLGPIVPNLTVYVKVPICLDPATTAFVQFRFGHVARFVNVASDGIGPEFSDGKKGPG